MKFSLFITLMMSFVVMAKEGSVFPGADEKTPSLSQYFSWINNTNEGPTEKQTLINLAFYQWLHDEYGMTLDIYAFDAGAIDGKRFYGSMKSERFRKQFPNSFDRIYKKAKAMNTRLGLWCGPDGFGDTPEEEAERIDMMTGLCRDYEWSLFKFDAVCGQLRRDKEPAFIKMMSESRKYSPDLIALNHRLPLTDEGKAYMTTFLMGGKETYIDVHMRNTMTCPHHRGGAISRELPPGLDRLTEDHGVCISSCLDFWDDDLILQAFNRCLILAPEVYGNPWLLRDDEYPKFARIYNLHRRYRDILVNGMELPESYGPYAVSRGDSKTRFLTLRNLTWNPVSYTVKLDKEIGLDTAESIELRQFHPTEKVIGSFKSGDKIKVEVLPFRACLLMATSEPCPEVAVTGCDYEVINDMAGKPVQLKLLGKPGTSSTIKLHSDSRSFKKAYLDGKRIKEFKEGSSLKVDFPGRKLKHPWHRKLATLKPTTLPHDAEALYEATCFAADSNALEVRALHRSGKTEIKAVKEARDAFFNQHVFKGRGLWDRYMFDGDPDTSYYACMRLGGKGINGGSLRLDFGEPITADQIVISVPDIYSLRTMKEQEGNIHPAEISANLKSWTKIAFIHGESTKINIPKGMKFRYLRIEGSLARISEVNAYQNGKALERSLWRGSNLFSPYTPMKFRKAWEGTIRLDEIAPGSYLCVALNGWHGDEGAYVALRAADGRLIGCPDRAPSFYANAWEAANFSCDANYTYYVPLTPEMEGNSYEVVVLGKDSCSKELQPDVWITANPIPFVSRDLTLK